jgi:MFS family permease
VLGPMLGALIVQKLSWGWIFWINVPIGLAAAAGFWAFLREAPMARRTSIDIVGAVLFTFGIAALMISLTEFGVGNEWSACVWALVFVATVFLFIAQERRAADPMVSFGLWGKRVIATVNGTAMLGGMALIGITTFLPIYVQVVLKRSSVVAGLALTMVMLGWPIGGTLAARIWHRFGLWSLIFGGAVAVPIGALAFALLDADSSPITAGIGSLVIGLGMGALSLASLILIQESVEMPQRGSATASNIFSRNLGSALGATFFGAVFNFGLTRTDGGAAVFSGDQLRELLQGTSTPGIAETGVRMALGSSLHLTFVAMLAISLLIVVLAFMLPREGLEGSRVATGKLP